MSIINCPLMGLQAAGIETECSGGERRAGRTETVDQGDAGVSGIAVYRGHGV